MIFFRRPAASVLMVCTANICRSPMAEWILRAKLSELGLQKKVRVDSAGTHASLAGRDVDPRARRVCEVEGVRVGRSRARQFRDRDFERFEYILAMEDRHIEWLLKACPQPFHDRISLVWACLEHESIAEIPDPYFGNQEGFATVFSLLNRAMDGFIAGNLVH